MDLRLLQLGDSALPIGGYSQSWGLEAAIEQGIVRDAQGLEDWVRSWLRWAVGPFEGVIVAVVTRSARQGDWQTIRRANDLLWAGLTPPTLRHASREMGEQLLALASAWPWAGEMLTVFRKSTDRHTLGWHHAPVFAVIAAATVAKPLEALLVYLHQAALGATGAGVRAVPIGHTHGQQVLARLHDDIHVLADDLVQRDLDQVGSFCPRYELLCHAQSELYTRIFRS